jgi:competence protein ComEA
VRTCSAEQLRTGLGLTSKEAEGIVAYREKNRDFKSVDDVKKVPEVNTAKVDAKKNLVVFH